jgi:Ca-activated chloride channel family protein
MAKFYKLYLAMLALVFAAAIGIYFAAPSSAQQSPSAKPAVSPTPVATPEDDDEPIRIDTELVNLSIRVVDRNNKPVGALKQSDFKVFEDNVLQPIEFFSQEEVPVNYGLLIDNSQSLRTQLEKVIDSSKIIINSNRKGDETCIIRFVNSEKIEVLQEFTSNREDLEYRLDNMYTEGGQTAIIDAVFLGAEKVDEYEKSKNPNDRKRRALIVISDGEDRDSFYEEKKLFDMLREADVQIYTIGFVGQLETEGGFIRKSPQKKAIAFLNRLASETGGKAYFPASVAELPEIARNIALELRTQYSIGYAPTNDKKDGTFRAIKVMIPDGPNKQRRIAQTRAGRTAALDPKQAPVLSKPSPTPAKP